MIRMLLRALGWLFYNLERLRMRCLGTYKTSLCRCGENSYVGGVPIVLSTGKCSPCDRIAAC